MITDEDREILGAQPLTAWDRVKMIGIVALLPIAFIYQLVRFFLPSHPQRSLHWRQKAMLASIHAANVFQSQKRISYAGSHVKTTDELLRAFVRKRRDRIQHREVAVPISAAAATNPATGRAVPSPTLHFLSGPWLGSGDGPVLFYAHGGGYLEPVVPGAHIPLARSMAQACGARAIVFIAYALCPEAQYPAHLVQVVEAMRFLLEREAIPPGELVLAGDSAGAHMMASLLAHMAAPAPHPRRADVRLPRRAAHGAAGAGAAAAAGRGVVRDCGGAGGARGVGARVWRRAAARPAAAGDGRRGGNHAARCEGLGGRVRRRGERGGGTGRDGRRAGCGAEGPAGAGRRRRGDACAARPGRGRRVSWGRDVAGVAGVYVVSTGLSMLNTYLRALLYSSTTPPIVSTNSWLGGSGGKCERRRREYYTKNTSSNATRSLALATAVPQKLRKIKDEAKISVNSILKAKSLGPAGDLDQRDGCPLQSSNGEMASEAGACSVGTRFAASSSRLSSVRFVSTKSGPSRLGTLVIPRECCCLRRRALRTGQRTRYAETALTATPARSMAPERVGRPVLIYSGAVPWDRYIYRKCRGFDPPAHGLPTCRHVGRDRQGFPELDESLHSSIQCHDARMKHSARTPLEPTCIMRSEWAEVGLHMTERVWRPTGLTKHLKAGWADSPFKPLVPDWLVTGSRPSSPPEYVRGDQARLLSGDRYPNTNIERRQGCQPSDSREKSGVPKGQTRTLPPVVSSPSLFHKSLWKDGTRKLYKIRESQLGNTCLLGG
ncbi:hypothetical protein CCM_06757 [Cordyceps militaris CM01]|uniref:Alpha/beta hydrolase fold-3 domain-containing protein n=1 Tax=Cordyceps militaris (strain CM01) TaxID=983644 RepID=G3JKW5_CORMM|nr:uncharacterized protein CCM_06757 [Cordyceps militaris CM01]EGX90339.1 hypothetical protein CCM_06757 [Cordyceps militaris CM01]